LNDPAPTDAAPRSVSFGEAFRFWLKLGFINFGGPTGQIAIMHDELVERRRWIGDRRFLHALNYCMVLPGPEAQQLAVYVGWLLHRTIGGLVAGTLFVLPGAALMLALSWSYAVHGNVPWVAALFFGVRAAVVAIVAIAVIRIGSKALKGRAMTVVAALAFVAIYCFKVPFPAIVLAAGIVGFVGGRKWPHHFAAGSGHGGGKGGAPHLTAVLDDDAPPPDHAQPSLARLLRCLAIGLVAWLGPLLLVAWWRGRGDVLTQQALFFSKCAMVTFGGAYAVLAYISQAAVETFGWMSAPEMLDGLGLAESTPGPLILVTQFVGYLGAHRTPSDLSPAVMGLLGTLVTLWATFAPCFLWIFAGAPWIERTRGLKSFAAALATITAAVVGVVLNLSVWLGVQTLFRRVAEKRFCGMTLQAPDFASVDLFALAIAVVAFVGMRKWKWGIIPVVVGGAALGYAARALGWR
jgi:chromate transporter